MKKADIERAKRSQQAERQRLSEERAIVEREMRKIERERAGWARERSETIAALRVLCSRFGDNDWDDTDALSEIVADHLAAPLEEMAARARRRIRRLQDELDASAGPVPVPDVEPADVHRILIVRGEQHGRRGYTARCTCGWSSYLAPTETDAERAGNEHAGRAARRPA